MKQILINEKMTLHYAKEKPRLQNKRGFLSTDGEPGGIRTHDKLIKSQLLYQLSYGPIVSDGAFLRVNDCSVKHPFLKK